MSYKVVILDQTLQKPRITFNYKMRMYDLDDIDNNGWTLEELSMMPYWEIKEKIKNRGELPDKNVVMFYYDSDGDLTIITDHDDYDHFLSSRVSKLYAFGNDQLKLSGVDVVKKVDKNLLNQG
ncbi:hypothetical protein HA402_008720 [Bradysia odoriphaga]|nr:hypothetical protein HA402_008720 [Bradysia odoriphaga]